MSDTPTPTCAYCHVLAAVDGYLCAACLDEECDPNAPPSEDCDSRFEDDVSAKILASGPRTPGDSPTAGSNLNGLLVCGHKSGASDWPCSELRGHFGGHQNAFAYWPRHANDDCPPEGSPSLSPSADPSNLARRLDTLLAECGATPRIVLPSSPSETADTPLHGVTWLLIRDGRVLLEKCPKKARVLGVGEWFEWPGVEVKTYLPLPVLEGSPVPPGPRGLFLMRPYVVTVSFDRCADGTSPDVNSEGVELRWFPIAEALASPVPQVRMMVAAALNDDVRLISALAALDPKAAP